MDGATRRKFASALLLYYTGISRNAVDILFEQTRNLSTSEKSADMERMVSLVEPFADAMALGDIFACGKLMHRNWELKQKMAAGISNPEIEEMCSGARKAGAIAAKIAGAGGGGFLLLMVPIEKQNFVLEA